MFIFDLFSVKSETFEICSNKVNENSIQIRYQD